jgi:hypothetical protein
MRTPVAGLPPLATSTITGDVQSGAAFAVRYGYVSSGAGLGQSNNFGATAELPLGMGGTVSLTAGVSASSAIGRTFRTNANALMLSAAGDTRITDLTLSGGRDATRLQLAVNGELGFSNPDNTSLWAGEVGLPLSLIQGGQARDAMRIVPYVTPAFAFTGFQRSGGGSSSGTTFLLGGGVALYNRASTIAFNLGFQYVGIANAQAQLGLGVTLGGR